MTVNSVSMTEVQQPQKSSKVKRQLGNALLTGALGGATVKIANKLSNDVYHCMEYCKELESNPEKIKHVLKAPTAFAKKLSKACSEIAISIYPKAFEDTTKDLYKIATNKAARVPKLFAAVALLGIIGAGIYKAGKIQGDGK